MRKVRKIKDMAVYDLGSQFMMACCDGMDINLTNVYSLNFSAAFLWQQLDNAYKDTEVLTELMYARYDESKDNISKDVVRQLDEWERMGLIKSSEE